MKLKMCKVSGLIVPIFIFSCLLFCCGTAKRRTPNDDAPLKKALVEEIIRKVCNLSLDIFSNEGPEEKTSLLIKIEEKLKKSTVSLGHHGDKYIKLIMKGVRSKVFGKEATRAGEIKNSSMNEVIESNNQNINKISKEADTENNLQKIGPTNLVKDELVNNIASKLESLAETYLSDAKTQEDRLRATENIKKNIVESVNRKHSLLHTKHYDMKTYIDLVGKGIEVMMQRNADKNNRRRMEITLTNNVNPMKVSQDHRMKHYKPIKGDWAYNNELDLGVNDLPKSQKSMVFRVDKSNEENSTSTCADVVEKTCHKIKLVKTFNCQGENTEIHISKLCDGVGDCSDFSDEQQCAKQAIESIQRANLLMTYIDKSLSQHCYSEMDENILTKQNKILSDILQNQLAFIHVHELDSTSKYSRRVFTNDIQAIKKTINNALTVVDTLSLALEETLCHKLLKDKTEMLDLGDVVVERPDIDKASETTTFAPVVCKCNGKNCIDTCSSECERICREKYSLSQWACVVVDGEQAVSLDMICDGKLDCYDESDENDCSGVFDHAKFEATQMYNFILQTLKTKASSLVFTKIRNRLNNMHMLVQKLQKLSMKRQADLVEVKRIRNRCFAELTAVYDDSLRLIRSPLEVTEMYSFLLLLHERLISALKRSHTGNVKVISPDGCVCSRNQCALSTCSKSCTRACAAEPQLTRYFCGGSSDLNSSIPIELICNGKNNCPKGDDENDCKDDVCRRHHLVVLRHNIRDAGKSRQDPDMGEALNSWKVKVRAILLVAEKNPRPTPSELRGIVAEVLHELVMAYATVEETRRSDPTAVFSEFQKWARVVVDTLKSCSN